MARTRISCTNRRDETIYAFVEIAPDCFELKPGQTLEIEYDCFDPAQPVEVELTAEGVTLWPNYSDFPDFTINGQPANDRSWKFDHGARCGGPIKA